MLCRQPGDRKGQQCAGCRQGLRTSEWKIDSLRHAAAQVRRYRLMLRGDGSRSQVSRRMASDQKSGHHVPGSLAMAEPESKWVRRVAPAWRSATRKITSLDMQSPNVSF